MPFFCPPPGDSDGKRDGYGERDGCGFGDSDGKRDGYGERDGCFMIVMRSVAGAAFDKECFFTIAYGQDGNMEKSPCQPLFGVRKWGNVRK